MSSELDKYMLLKSPAVPGEDKHEKQPSPKGSVNSRNVFPKDGKHRREVNDFHGEGDDGTKEKPEKRRRSSKDESRWLRSTLSNYELLVHKWIPVLLFACIVTSVPFSRSLVMWIEGSVAAIASILGRWAIVTENKKSLRYYQFWLCFVFGVGLATLPLLVTILKLWSICIVLLLALHIYQILLINKSLQDCNDRQPAFQLTSPGDAMNMDNEPKESFRKIRKETGGAEVGKQVYYEDEKDSIIKNDAMALNYQLNLTTVVL